MNTTDAHDSNWSRSLLKTFCTRKIGYDTKAEAEAARATLPLDDRATTHSYKCPACSKWHVGHYISGWERAHEIYGNVPPPKSKPAKSKRQIAYEERVRQEQEAAKARREERQRAHAERMAADRVLYAEKRRERFWWHCRYLTWEDEGGNLGPEDRR